MEVFLFRIVRKINLSKNKFFTSVELIIFVFWAVNNSLKLFRMGNSDLAEWAFLSKLLLQVIHCVGATFISWLAWEMFLRSPINFFIYLCTCWQILEFNS